MSKEDDAIIQAAPAICARCDGEGGFPEITNIPWRTAKALGLGYAVCPDCGGTGIAASPTPPGAE